MSAPAQPLSKTPITRLGNTAMLVHAIGIGTGGALAVYGYLYDTANKDDAMVMLGMGLAVAVVAWYWSMLLRARALWHGESAFWPTVLSVLSGIELLGVSLLFWRVAAPVLALGILGSGIAAVIFNGRRERKYIQRGGEPWDRGIRYQRKVRTFGVIFLISALTVLPIGLRAYVLYFWPTEITFHNSYYRLSNWVPASFDRYFFNSKTVLRSPYESTRAILSGGVHATIRNEIIQDSNHPLHRLCFNYLTVDDLKKDPELAAVCKAAILEQVERLKKATPLARASYSGRYGAFLPVLCSLKELKVLLKFPQLLPGNFLYELISSLPEVNPALLRDLKPELFAICSSDPGWLAAYLERIPKGTFTQEELDQIGMDYLRKVPLTDRGLFEVEYRVRSYWINPEVRALIQKNWSGLTPEARDAAVDGAYSHLSQPSHSLVALQVLQCGIVDGDSQYIRRNTAYLTENLLINKNWLKGPRTMGAPPSPVPINPLPKTPPFSPSELNRILEIQAALDEALKDRLKMMPQFEATLTP